MSNIDTTAALPEATPRWRWRRIVLLAVLLAIALPIAAWAGIHGFQRIQAQRELDEAVAEVGRKDAKWRLVDLQAERKPVVDDQNAALVVIRIKEQLPKGALFAPPRVRAERRLTPKQVEVLRTQLQPLENALANAAQLSDLSLGRFPESEPRDPLSASKGCEDASKVALLLRMQAMLMSQSNDADGALRAALSIAGAARAVGDEPHLVAQLARIVCRNELRACLERTLAQGQSSEPLLAKVQLALEEEAECPSALQAARGELARHHDAALAAEAGDTDLDKILLQVSGRGEPVRVYLLGPWPGTVARKAHARTLRQLSDLVAVCQLPPEEQGPPARQFRENLHLVTDGYVLFPGLDKRVLGLSQLFRRNLTMLRCCIVAVAIERFRLANNRWPEKLEELLPTQLAKIPLDAVEGGSLRFERRKDGVSIFSSGQDSLRLFDPAQRRQPGSDIEEPDPFESRARAQRAAEGEKKDGAAAKEDR